MQMNNWNFTGNVGKDATLKYTPKNDAVLQFTVAVKSGYGANENTTWVTCSLWGKRAESLEMYVKKGQQVAISGEANNRKWQDKEGADRYSLEVRVNEIELVGGRSTSSDARQPSVNEAGSNVQSNDFDEESEVPF
jgi:single-strand DNA-binding protein